MYFINFAKCSVCRQKKSVASSRQDRAKKCIDCDRKFYLEAAKFQKSFWLENTSHNYKS